MPANIRTQTPSAVDVTPAGYSRNSSGMVREVALVDMAAYDAAAPGGLGLVLAISLFFVFASFPGADLYIALPVALGAIGVVWVTFALLATVFPRAGGDYLYGSRVIHPVVGLASNVAVFFSSLLGVGFWGAYLVSFGIGPTFVIIGLTTHHLWWVHAAATLSHKGWEFLIAVVFIGLVSLLSFLRTKLVVRFMTWSFLLASAGFFVAFIAMLVTSHSSFVHTLNSFSAPYTHTRDTYSATIAAGAKTGLVYPSVHGYSLRGTLGAIIVGLNISVAYYAGVYMAGEMKGAPRRSRQLISMLGSGYAQGVMVMIAAFLFVHVAGYNFFAAANAGAYSVPVSPYYNFFASMVSGSPVLSIVICVTFLGFFPPAFYVNSAIVQRALFAWSFDGLIPRRFATVSERTRTPVVAISTIAVLGVGAAAYILWASSAAQVLAVTFFMTIFTVIVVALAGLLLQARLPHVFANGPADWKVRGIPVLQTAAALSIALGVAWAAGSIYFHQAFAVGGWATLPLVIVGCFFVAGVWYRLAVAMRRRQGVDLEYVYRTIPPD